jgi:hypothetical protein
MTKEKATENSSMEKALLTKESGRMTGEMAKEL